MATRPGDVSDYVREVVAAFDKAVTLVQKIEDRKIVKSDPEAARDLYKSLTLGPTIVKGYFDADCKRLGPAYMVGDYESQVQLRDVLLNLKTLIGDLSDVLIEGKDVDFETLQDASDNCRVNAGVCLGQLSQRLADPMRMHLNNSPHQYMSSAPSTNSPGLHYSSSRSTHSSAGGRFPMTPDPYRQMQPAGPQYEPRRQEYEKDYSSHHRNDTATSIQESYSNWSATSQLFTERDAEDLSKRRPSSTLLSAEDDALLSPALLRACIRKEMLLPGEQDLNRDSYTSFHNTSIPQGLTAPTNVDRPPTRERYGPDDYSPRTLEQHGPFFPDRSSGQSFTSYASRAVSSNQSDLDQIRENPRATLPEPLRLPHRSASQQQTRLEPPNPPPRGPVPAVPVEPFAAHPPSDKHTNLPVRMPSQIDRQRFPVPPSRNDLESRTATFAAPQGAMSIPQSQLSPTFMPSMSVQQAMQNNYVGKHQRGASIASASSSSPPQSSAFQQFSALDRATSNPAPTEYTHDTTPDPYRGFSLLLLPDESHNQYRYSNSAKNARQPLSIPARPFNDSTASVQQPPTLMNSPVEPRPASQHKDVTIDKDAVQSYPVVRVGAQSTQSVPLPQNLPLTLPTEKNTHPFCKSAFRLFLGITKKSFIAANRPVGMTTYILYWRCDKCHFEGPMAQIPGPLDKKGRPGKPEKVFDPTVRECGPMTSAVVGPDGRGEGSGGIRYKWAFLAKCHVSQKSQPDFGGIGKPSGTMGSFGCLFCTAEGAARGWTTTFNGQGSTSLGMNGPGLNDAASTFSGASGHSAGSGAAGSTPVFGNLQLFMDHLQMHRREENWPCEEMRGRMKCVVGRVADRGDDWEINFLPL